ncbi:MAG: tetratricopeptide repeat protein [Spirochaetaceae bacterium]|jgi:tetratricopeptide (TPR) repeat protein|nr:tetratricopeptide repeat protein [Spirochaetaceae bacterium]
MKRFFQLSFLFLLPLAGAFSYPDYFVSLRDAVYAQELSADGLAPLYREALGKARESLVGEGLYIMLSRCEYMMGRAYQYEERKNEAAARYEEGISWAEKALKEGESSTGWQMLAENISQSCAVKPVSYALANGLKVERYAKNALKLDPRNAAALYMVAARWVFAPSPFNNYKKGAQMMEDIITQGSMEQDDRFNVYSAIGYAYLQQKKYAEARPWLLKSLEVYPANKYVRGLLEKS